MKKTIIATFLFFLPTLLLTDIHASITETEPNNTQFNSDIIECGQTIIGSLSACSDDDTFQLIVSEPAMLHINFNSPSATHSWGYSKWEMRIYDITWNKLFSMETEDDSSNSVYFEIYKPGTYFFVVGPVTTCDQGTYTFNIAKTVLGESVCSFSKNCYTGEYVLHDFNIVVSNKRYLLKNWPSSYGEMTVSDNNIHQKLEVAGEYKLLVK